MKSELIALMLAGFSFPWFANAQTGDDVINEALSNRPAEIQDDSMKLDKKICSGSKKYPVHLTFDDGPDPKITPQVLEVLKKAGIKATFLISTNQLTKGSAEEIRGRKRLIEKIKQDGHTVGSHSYEHIEHANLKTHTREQILNNIQRSFDEIDKLNLSKPIPFRFPYGSGWIEDSKDSANQDMGKEAILKVKAAGYQPFHWDIDTEDWSKVRRKALPMSALSQICRSHGGIILMHDVHQWTADNLPTFIESIRQSGHTFVSESEIIKYSEQKDGKPLNSLMDRLGRKGGCIYTRGSLEHVAPLCNTSSSSETKKMNGVQ
ncbi:polysaccharide deacetylase family protein [Bdellovibrio sp. HCB209]|uniref:polysaccharide deacetylase family protein n=1 Tax=Bdellovibrio sp. HCB209 TaxID=3394354 RepID=UPI0039B6DF0B